MLTLRQVLFKRDAPLQEPQLLLQLFLKNQSGAHSAAAAAAAFAAVFSLLVQELHDELKLLLLLLLLLQQLRGELVLLFLLVPSPLQTLM